MKLDLLTPFPEKFDLSTNTLINNFHVHKYMRASTPSHILIFVTYHDKIIFILSPGLTLQTESPVVVPVLHIGFVD